MENKQTTVKTLIGLPIVLVVAGGVAFFAAQFSDSLKTTSVTDESNLEVEVANTNSTFTNQTVATDDSEYTILRNLLIEQLNAFRPTSSANEITAEQHIGVLCEFIDSPAGLDNLPFGSLRNEWTETVTLFKENDARTTVCPFVPLSDRSTAELQIQQDLDNDGLPVWAEAWYGTSETSIDTDGDGYSDPEELANNFNPLGPGERTGL